MYISDYFDKIYIHKKLIIKMLTYCIHILDILMCRLLIYMCTPTTIWAYEYMNTPNDYSRLSIDSVKVVLSGVAIIFSQRKNGK